MAELMERCGGDELVSLCSHLMKMKDVAADVDVNGSWLAVLFAPEFVDWQCVSEIDRSLERERERVNKNYLITMREVFF